MALVERSRLSLATAGALSPAEEEVLPSSITPPNKRSEVRHEIHALRAAHRAWNPGRQEAAPPHRAQQRTLSADARGAAQAGHLRRRGGIRRVRHHRAPLPLRRL